MAETWSPNVGDVIADKYRIDELIGRGGFGAVYAATHKMTGKRVAVKWMHPELSQNAEMVKRFMREARIAGQIDHPNIVDVTDADRYRGGLYIVMELLHGQPLSSLLAGTRPDPDVLIAMMMPALRGIAAAHDRGVIHRDLKPDNIYLCEGPDGSPREAKVLDFGISKMAQGVDGAMSLTQTGSVIGTPYYMAPEQVMGERDLDRRTDVYAVGVILYEALTGRLPFTADVYSALVVKIATELPPDIRDLRPDLDPILGAVVMRAIARKRDERFPDVPALARALEPFCPGVTFAGPPTTPALIRPQAVAVPQAAVPSVETPMSRETAAATLPVHPRRGLLFGGLALGAIGVAVGIWVVTSGPDTVEPPDVATSAGTDAAAPVLPPEPEATDAAPAGRPIGATGEDAGETALPVGVEPPPEAGEPDRPVQPNGQEPPRTEPRTPPRTEPRTPPRTEPRTPTPMEPVVRPPATAMQPTPTMMDEPAEPTVSVDDF